MSNRKDSTSTPHRTQRKGHTRHQVKQRRQTTARKAVLAITSAAVLAGIAAPFLAGSPTPSPAAMRTDPAVRSLLTYTAGLDGSPSTKTGSDAAALTLTFHQLPDGSTRVSKKSASGTCYFLTIPASASSAPSDVQAGTPEDCRP